MRRLTPALLAGAGLIACLVTGPLDAAERRSKTPDAPRTESVGSPNEGRLQGGKKLEASKVLRPVRSHRWGVPALVGMLERSAARVAKKFSGAQLVVGDLSRKGGGEVDGHRSHESGRDADIGFYMRRGNKPWAPGQFVPIDAEGKAAGYPSVTFDDARNWALVEAWLTDREASVQLILVAHHIKLRLLAEARRAGAPAEVQNRAASLMVHPKRGLPHDNHFHVRVACPRSSDDCIEYGTREKKVAAQKPPRRGARAAQNQRGTTKKRPARKKS